MPLREVEPCILLSASSRSRTGTSAASFKVDEAAKKVVPPPGVAPVPSQFDAIAVEAAMRIKDAGGDAKVTIMSMGAATARDVIKHGLAMGGDEGVLLVDDAFNNSTATARRRCSRRPSRSSATSTSC